MYIIPWCLFSVIALVFARAFKMHFMSIIENTFMLCIVLSKPINKSLVLGIQNHRAWIYCKDYVNSHHDQFNKVPLTAPGWFANFNNLVIGCTIQIKFTGYTQLYIELHVECLLLFLYANIFMYVIHYKFSHNTHVC